MKMSVETLKKELKAASGIYWSPIEIQFRALRSQKLRKMVSLGKFAQVASLFVDSFLGTLHSYFFHKDFRRNLNFSLEHQINSSYHSSLALALWSEMIEIGV